MKSFKEIADSVAARMSESATSTITASNITSGDLITYDPSVSVTSPYYDMITGPYYIRDCTNEEHKDIGCLPYACVLCQLDTYMTKIELEEHIIKMGGWLTTSLYSGTLLSTSGANGSLIVNIGDK